MSRTHQLRRYTLARGREDDFLQGWAAHIPALRAASGFRIEFAYLDRENSRFVWAVSTPGSQADFLATQDRYYAAKSQAGHGNGDPAILLGTEVSFVTSALDQTELQEIS